MANRPDFGHACFISLNAFVLGSETEEESTGGSAAAEEGSADEDSGCESPPDPGGIMDFSTLSIAEQLTRMDSVPQRSFSHFLSSSFRCIDADVCFV